MTGLVRQPTLTLPYDLTQQIDQVHRDLTQQFNGLQEGQASIRERMTVVEQRLAADSS